MPILTKFLVLKTICGIFLVRNLIFQKFYLGPPQVFCKDTKWPNFGFFEECLKKNCIGPTLIKYCYVSNIKKISNHLYFYSIAGSSLKFVIQLLHWKKKKTTSTTKPKETLIYIIDFWVQNIIRILLNYHVVHHPKCWPKHKFSMLKLAGFKTKRPQHSLSTMF